MYMSVCMYVSVCVSVCVRINHMSMLLQQTVFSFCDFLKCT